MASRCSLRCSWPLALALACGCKHKVENTQREDPPPRVLPAASQAAPAPSASSSPPPPYTCKADVWPDYGHDAQRTSRSAECIEGPLRQLWKASPVTPVKERPPAFEHAVSTGEGIFLVGVRGKSSTLHALNLDGSARWDHDTRTDLHFAYWPIAAHGVVGMNDDGTFLLDPQTGKMRHNLGLDSWGQMAADAERFYWTNAWHVHGPALYLGGYSSRGEALWKQSKYGGTLPMDMMDDLGGVALDGELVFQSANYKFASFSGVFAFEGATGKPRWAKNGTPIGYASVSEGKVYVVEKRQRERRLVARAERDGEEVWSTLVPGALGASPAHARGLTLVDTDRGVLMALESSTGRERWRVELGPKRANAVGNETTLAIAANDVVVVTFGKEIVLLSLLSGEVRWRGAVSGSAVHSPVLADGRLYVVAGGELLAFEGVKPDGAKPDAPRPDGSAPVKPSP